MASLFQRLDEEEAIVRGELDALREKVAAGEERLARLTITRETAGQLLGEEEDRTVPPAAPAAASASQPEVPGVEFIALESALAGQPAPAGASVAAGPQRVEWAVGMERILAVLATSGRVMRTRQIAAAIGEDASLPTRVETTRSRLKRLVKQGKVVERKPGYFRIAPAARATEEAPGNG